MSELKYFVDAAWLLEHRNDEDVFVIDSRFDLFDPAGYGAQAYAEAHIAGAYYFDIDQDITENKGEHGGRRGPADPAVLAAKLAAIGVTNDSTIVCYDDGVYSAPRAWWQFRYMGLDKVYVLDGGFYGWKQKGYPVSAEPTAPRGEGHVTYTIRDEMFADKDYVVAAIGDPDKIIVDARGHQRYTGEVEPLYSKRGHIPGAINIHYLVNMKEEWLVGTPEQWRVNLAPCFGKEAILYCGSAIEAAIEYMFFAELGERARLYVGSMSDWVGYDDLPVEGDYE